MIMIIEENVKKLLSVPNLFIANFLLLKEHFTFVFRL